ncbi:uncharacterized protein B0T23DRAFT_132175 [Neurospora hispaniola]|uniref:Uncharacterized protein n=1 Tax=Neurospora hispaniola TaxID=588809 RepID=A0AAJ0IBA6_9PEZI|nr:hypothetical protein B0T23DRAFT_132175 [Neurospora hispaniola]
MQGNLFKLFAIAAAFSAVHSAPVETADVTKAHVNGTQVDGPQINGTQISDSFRVAGVRALPQRSQKNLYNAFYRFSERLTLTLHLLRLRKLAIRGTSLILAKERRREIFSSGLARAIPAGTKISALLGDVRSAICSLTAAATHGLLAGSVEV